ncbi:hypothetical protein QJS66_21450 [Kocuria rhizophila]|nr:hypothetical protein QJS66_21450 [Kocuria rhizophila]
MDAPARAASVTNTPGRRSDHSWGEPGADARRLTARPAPAPPDTARTLRSSGGRADRPPRPAPPRSGRGRWPSSGLVTAPRS